MSSKHLTFLDNERVLYTAVMFQKNGIFLMLLGA